MAMISIFDPSAADHTESSCECYCQFRPNYSGVRALLKGKDIIKCFGMNNDQHHPIETDFNIHFWQIIFQHKNKYILFALIKQLTSLSVFAFFILKSIQWKSLQQLEHYILFSHQL